MTTDVIGAKPRPARRLSAYDMLTAWHGLFAGAWAVAYLTGGGAAAHGGAVAHGIAARRAASRATGRGQGEAGRQGEGSGQGDAAEQGIHGKSPERGQAAQPPGGL